MITKIIVSTDKKRRCAIMSFMKTNSDEKERNNIWQKIPDMDLLGRVRVFFRWFVLGCITGVAVGVIGAAFFKSIALNKRLVSFFRFSKFI